ncbi:hypothetical protein PG987_003360 [Apiospora arundinis]
MTVRDEFMQDAYARIREAVSSNDNNSLDNGNALPPTLPQPSQLSRARRGRQATVDHLLEDIAPALNGQNRSSRYWGFVTGAALPVAEVADNLVSAYDQNVQVHLPNQTIATEVEDAALKMLLGVLRLGSVDAWAGRTFTTGATASNILGLACGREAVLARRLSAAGCNGKTASELGILAACLRAGVKEIRVLTSMGHSSLSKAASIVGLGSATVHELPHSADEPWRLDLEAVQKELQREGAACIIVLSAGELLASSRALSPETDEFSGLHRAAAGLELADSITVDGHKLLNVPYDCGVFFTRQVSTLTSVCQNPNAVYLNSEASDIQSPLNVGLENSRRFRALPAYAVLLSEGREGLADMFARMVRLTRGIAGVVRDSPDYILLPDEQGQEHGADLEDTHICVLFRAREDSLNNVLVEAINATGLWYVSSTKWKGQKAVRVAVANWRINVTEDQELVRQSLASIAQEHKTAESKS